MDAVKIVNGHGPKPTPTADTLAAVQAFFAANKEVKAVRYESTDYANVVRSRLTTKARALHMAAHPGSGIETGSPISSAVLANDALLLELINPKCDVWVPDWPKLRKCTYAPTHAVVPCFLEEKYEEGVERFARDPRSYLYRVVREAKEKHGVEFLIGHEIEFVLLDSPTATEPVDSPAAVWSTSALRHPAFAVLEDAVDALEEAEITVWGYHQEGGRGKYELATGPLPPVEAADALTFARETIKTMAAKHGYHATLHPKAFDEGPTAGAHMHISVSNAALEKPFLAGLLNRLSALSAIALPSVDSYMRSDQFGDRWIMWATENKFNPLVKKGPAYWEYRVPDAMANIFLLTGAFIRAGLAGVEGNEESPVKERIEKSTSFKISDEARKKFNVTKQLPRDLAESVQALKDDESFKNILGEKLYERYIYNKEQEVEKSGGMTRTARRLAYVVNY